MLLKNVMPHVHSDRYHWDSVTYAACALDDFFVATNVTMRTVCLSFCDCHGTALKASLLVHLLRMRRLLLTVCINLSSSTFDFAPNGFLLVRIFPKTCSG